MFGVGDEVRWPTGEAYPLEVWKVIKVTGRDYVIENRDGYRATVHHLTVTEL